MKKDLKVQESESLSEELTDKDLELVIGGIMSEIVIRETIENVSNLSNKIDQINNKVKQQ